jgi:hypothetical protein
MEVSQWNLFEQLIYTSELFKKRNIDGMLQGISCPW